MITRSEKAVGTMFYVPNNQEGQAFLKAMRKHLNRAVHRIRIRGRNPDRKSVSDKEGVWHARYQQSIPQRHATYFAVYIDSPTLNDQRNRDFSRLYAEWDRTAKENAALRELLHMEPKQTPPPQPSFPDFQRAIRLK